MNIGISATCLHCVTCRVHLRLSKGVSDEIEDATISIDETKISEIEATNEATI